MRTKLVLALTALFAVGALNALTPATADAGAYPTEKCVTGKQKALGKWCGAYFKAHAKFLAGSTKDDAAADRDAALAAAFTKLDDAVSKAEAKSLKKNVDCTVSGEDVGTLVTDLRVELDALVGDYLVDPLDSGDKADVKCRSKVAKNAGKACAAIFKAHSKHMGKRAKDPLRATLTASIETAAEALTDGNAKAGDCLAAPRGADPAEFGPTIEDAVAAAVDDTVVAPVDLMPVGEWVEYDPEESIDYPPSDLSPLESRCVFDTDWKMWARRGTENKLVVYYQGGGACWSPLTCGVETCDTNVGAGDHPDNFQTGFVDFDNPDNPFRNWNAVFVPYCTCDIHWGTKEHYKAYPSQPPVVPAPFRGYHRGRINALVAEKWAREHFVNPEQVVATGSSAGAYGALLNGTFLHEVYPSSRFDIVGDAGMGAITQNFLENTIDGNHGIQNWFDAIDLPRYIPALDLDDITELTLSDLVIEAATYYQDRNSHYAQYTTAWDWNQTLFLNAMVQTDIADLATWRLSSCGWNDTMLHLNDILLGAEVPNLHTFIGPGSDHTTWGNDKVYTQLVERADKSGSITMLDWASDMIVHPPGPNYTDVECEGSDCDHECIPDAVFGLTCTTTGEHQDHSTAPLPDCDGAGADIQACERTDAPCDEIEATFCLFLGGTPQGAASTCP